MQRRLAIIPVPIAAPIASAQDEMFPSCMLWQTIHAAPSRETKIIKSAIFLINQKVMLAVRMMVTRTAAYLARSKERDASEVGVNRVSKILDVFIIQENNSHPFSFPDSCFASEIRVKRFCNGLIPLICFLLSH